MGIRSKYRRRLRPGEILIREGEHGQELFVLEEGLLDVYIRGQKVGQIDARESQEFVGEVAVLLGRPRTATVVAAADTLLLAIPVPELDQVLSCTPSLGTKLARSLCKKLAQSAHAHAVLFAANNQVAESGNTEVSVKNYMKGVLALMENLEAAPSPEIARQLCEYFRATNPWGIRHGDSRNLLFNETEATLDLERQGE